MERRAWCKNIAEVEFMGLVKVSIEGWEQPKMDVFEPLSLACTSSQHKEVGKRNHV